MQRGQVLPGCPSCCAPDVDASYDRGRVVGPPPPCWRQPWCLPGSAPPRPWVVTELAVHSPGAHSAQENASDVAAELISGSSQRAGTLQPKLLSLFLNPKVGKSLKRRRAVSQIFPPLSPMTPCQVSGISSSRKHPFCQTFHF